MRLAILAVNTPLVAKNTCLLLCVISIARVALATLRQQRPSAERTSRMAVHALASLLISEVASRGAFLDAAAIVIEIACGALADLCAIPVIAVPANLNLTFFQSSHLR